MITHDRWQRIKEIFQSAQELGAAERVDFLNKACAGDESIREEVEALLTADASNEEFLSAPAYEFAAGILAEGGESEFSGGTKVGRYTILCPLGAGGMGQIYLAEDAKLGRKIALKLISPEFATDPRRVYRFEQEARAASALNHPNVCVIHEIATTDSGRHFIAMEYIQGITLRDQLSRGALTVLEALNVVVQVAEALSSAHATSIVHRDIKPENIMLRPDGYVKVLDFGLAKLTEILPESPRLHEVSTTVLTEAGTLMGTVKYMSPEQLRKARVDERTDIWSLGIVLYEMLTGVTPFEAPSANQMVELILEPRPAPLLPAEFPSPLQEIVRKALEKDRDSRYQTITRLASDLKTLQMELHRQAEGDVPAKTPALLVSFGPRGNELKTRKIDAELAILSRLKSQAISTADFLFSEIRSHKAAAFFTGATGILAFLLLLPSAVRFSSDLINPPSAPQQTIQPAPATSMTKLTNAGSSVCSAISHDGKQVAHTEEQGGKQRLVVTNTATFATVDLVPPAEVQYLGISFSRDNNYLYFTRKENNSSILYRLSLPGSAPVKVKDWVDSPISFSPEGSQFAFVRHDQTKGEYSLIVSDVDGGTEQTIATRSNGNKFSLYGLAWSPDGSMIVCPSGSWEAEGYHMRLVAFDLKDRKEFAIGDQSWFSILQLAWQDDMSSLVVSARERPATDHRLWRITYPSGEARSITDDTSEYTTVSLSGDKIVAVRTDRSWRIWVASLDDFARAKAIVSGVGLNYGLSWTAQGKIVFSSMTQDRLNISRVDPNGSNQVQLTANDADNYNPAVSADGHYIVFASNQNSGNFNIWRMNTADGSDAKQLTFTDGNFYPSVSPDNQWVAYDNQRESTVSVWKVPLQGGDPVKVVEKYRMPVFSPDSQLIAARYHLKSGSRDVTIFSAQDGQPLRKVPVPILEWQRVQWLDGHTLSYIKNVDGYSNIWSYDLDSGAEKQLTHFNSDQIYAYAWSPDYKQVACQRGSKISDVTIISSER